MLSEGKSDVDNVYYLREGTCSASSASSHFKCLLEIGILTLHLDKESYERAGLVGKPDGVKGKRGSKPRWGKSKVQFDALMLTGRIVVEIELRSPSMLHGKKSFDRIVYAFKNVLNTPVTWLFLDLGEDSTLGLLVHFLPLYTDLHPSPHA